jgi:hypothetical protein
VIIYIINTVKKGVAKPVGTGIGIIDDITEKN